MNRILIVEADTALARKLCRSFTEGDNQALSCSSMKIAEELLHNEKFEMVIIDTQLPDGNGYDLIYELGLNIYRSKEAIIIIMLPNDKKPDMMELTERGIADYITKPFSTAVLKAKVYTHFCKKKKEKDFSVEAGERFEATGSSSIQSIGGEHKVVIDRYMFDFDNGKYSVDGRDIKLNVLEQSILRTLVENKGIVLKRKAFTDKIMSEHKTHIDEKLLADTVRVLMDKLEAYDYMKTIYGIGYMWALSKDGVSE